VPSSRTIPDHFTLALRADQQRIPCHIVWRKEGRMGWRLIGSARRSCITTVRRERSEPRGWATGDSHPSRRARARTYG
jgi:hypothetical protein